MEGQNENELSDFTTRGRSMVGTYCEQMAMTSPSVKLNGRPPTKM